VTWIGTTLEFVYKKDQIIARDYFLKQLEASLKETLKMALESAPNEEATKSEVVEGEEKCDSPIE